MKRFQGNARKRLLQDALRQQRTLSCCEPAISKLVRASSLRTYPPNSQLIIQGSDDNRIAFILRGRVDILVKDQKVADRTSGQHVGEMSVIDPSSRRSATVVATEHTDVAWVDEKDFTRIASAHPQLWRELAVELANRLRQRGALVRDRNAIPEVFIGSSSESVKVANSIERALKPDPIRIHHWKRGVFGASEATIESLEKLLPKCDFAVLILTADDKMRIRNKKKVAPRDNVVFELGLFMGAIGRSRTFMVVEDRKELRLPPDLSGITYLPLNTRSPTYFRNSVAAAVVKIRKRISGLNTR
jgi:CRP/FNR family transcriptional regulator, cyclic AMP receptor protein